MAEERPWSDADRELVREAIHSRMDNVDQQTDAVLDALIAGGRLARSPYAGEGEPRCGEPYPDGGSPCQLRPGHDTHARPASGGFDTWRRDDHER